MDDETQVTASEELEDFTATDEGGEQQDDKVAQLESIIVDLKKTAGVKSVKELKAKLTTKVVEDAKPEVKAPADTTITPESLKRINLRLDGYSEDEVNFILRSGGDPKDEYVQTAITSLREKKAKEAKSAEASVSSSSRSPIYKRYTEQQLKDMPLAEMEKLIRTLPPQD